MRRETLAAAAVLTLASAGVTACGGAATHTGSSKAPAAPSSNERRLTRAESLRLVAWARTFRECVLDRGTAVGQLAKTETRISMSLPAGTVAADVIPTTTTCGEKQGGPPQKSSLQYRPGEIVLYLPKQCLLDAKVAAT